MIEKITNSFELVKLAFKIIMQEKELLVYTILSVISSILILITFIGVGSPFINQLAESNEYVIYGFLFIYYLVFSFITFFFNTAVITSVNRILKGEGNKLGDGIRDSINNLRSIFQWSLVSATVSIIIRILQDKLKDNALGNLIVGGLGASWSILTFFAFPLMILNKKSLIESIKESGKLFKSTWGERAAIHVGVGLFWAISFFVIFAIGIALGFFINIWFGAILIGFGILGIFLLATLTDVVIKTVIFEYAQTGKIPSIMGESKIINKIIVKK